MELQVENTVNSLKETLKDTDLPIEVRLEIEYQIKKLKEVEKRMSNTKIVRK